MNFSFVFCIYPKYENFVKFETLDPELERQMGVSYNYETHCRSARRKKWFLSWFKYMINNSCYQQFCDIENNIVEQWAAILRIDLTITSKTIWNRNNRSTH
uniref:Uncharacterized protein n=1 Tax=Heterorhabditis bacteriophora TaxID=37862 RepID=A0A1I7WLV0_HETBA